MIRTLCFFFTAFCGLAEAKVSIFAHYFGQPEFVKYQYLFLKKNLLDEFEFVVFEDAPTLTTSKQIRAECEKYGIHCVHIPASVFEKPKLPIRNSYISLKSPSFQCSLATQYIYDHYVTPSKNPCLILDNDIFLLSPASIEQFLENYSFGYVRQQKRTIGKPVVYMLPNFIIFNPEIMPKKETLNFNMGLLYGVQTDSGGYTYFYLHDYFHLGKQIPCEYLWTGSSPLKECYSAQCPLLFGSSEWGSHYFMGKETFLHIRMGSNWSANPKYLQMRKEIEYLFEELLK